MKAWQFAAFGGPERLELCDVERPSPGAGEALVRVTHCGVNPIDRSVVGGRFPWLTPPHTPGTEVVGVVEARLTQSLLLAHRLRSFSGPTRRTTGPACWPTVRLWRPA